MIHSGSTSISYCFSTRQLGSVFHQVQQLGQLCDLVILLLESLFDLKKKLRLNIFFGFNQIRIWEKIEYHAKKYLTFCLLYPA